MEQRRVYIHRGHVLLAPPDSAEFQLSPPRHGSSRPCINRLWRTNISLWLLQPPRLQVMKCFFLHACTMHSSNTAVQFIYRIIPLACVGICLVLRKTNKLDCFLQSLPLVTPFAACKRRPRLNARRLHSHSALKLEFCSQSPNQRATIERELFRPACARLPLTMN